MFCVLDAAKQSVVTVIEYLFLAAFVSYHLASMSNSRDEVFDATAISNTVE
jgi:hypothetical protein